MTRIKQVYSLPYYIITTGIPTYYLLMCTSLYIYHIINMILSVDIRVLDIGSQRSSCWLLFSWKVSLLSWSLCSVPINVSLSCQLHLITEVLSQLCRDVLELSAKQISFFASKFSKSPLAPSLSPPVYVKTYLSLTPSWVNQVLQHTPLQYTWRIILWNFKSSAQTINLLILLLLGKIFFHSQ